MKSKYKSHIEWCKVSPHAFDSARKGGFLEQICEEMGWPLPKKQISRKPRGYWVKELVIADAQIYTSRVAWAIGNQTAHNAALKNGWMDECIAHMPSSGHMPSGYWTYERIFADALNWTNADLYRVESKSYRQATQRGITMEVMAHMTGKKMKPVGYWTKERCMESAKPHNSINKWVKVDSGAVNNARKHGWMDECTAHMIITTVPAGHWDIKENTLGEARRWGRLSEWDKHGSRSAMNAARKHGWMGECTAHMTQSRKPKGHWDIKVNVLENAKLFNTPSKWTSANSTVVMYARKNGWYDEATAHMKKSTDVPNGYWSKGRCIEKGRKYNDKKEWRTNCYGSYQVASREGWMDECCKHMNIFKSDWTKENILKDIERFDSPKEWRADNKSIQAARKNGWYKEFIKHMERKNN